MSSAHDLHSVRLESPLRHPAVLDDSALLADCKVRRQRRSGPGGQHRNKVETAVVITHLPTGIRGEASERRSQEQNRVVAIRRLRTNLAIEYRTEATNLLKSHESVDESPIQPSQLWQKRCRKMRISINSQHEEFPAILAEAMDNLAWCSWEVKKASEQLSCSPTQLIKLLQLEPRAFRELNRQRFERGLQKLR